MTYWYFHAVFILPIIGVLWHLRRSGPPHSLPRPGPALLILGILALAYTTPWDNYLVARGVWSYAPDRVVNAWRIGYVPLEEYAFFILQTILTGLFLLHFASHDPGAVELLLLGREERRRRPRWYGLGVSLALLGLGVQALRHGERFTYFGLIAIWAAPVLGLQWLYGGDVIWRVRRLALRAILIPTVYLWIADRIALEWRIWSVSPEFSTGWNLLDLPLEEALFFLLTNILVVQGLLLYFEFLARRTPEVAAPALRVGSSISA